MAGIETPLVDHAAPDLASLLETAGPMTPGPGVECLIFGDRFALFHEGRQALAELNETAHFIWERLAQGEPPRAVAAALAGAGASLAEAGTYVEDALDAWLADGWIVPVETLTLLEGSPSVRLDLSILDVGFAVEIFGPPPMGLLEILEPLRGSGAIVHRLGIAPWRDGSLLLVDGRSKGLFGGQNIAPAVKGALSERLVSAVTGGFVAHGGLVARSSRRLFLSGGPGAGKSTLALALGKAGFECLSDDIVHVDGRGWMKGAPFAPAMKSGAWPLLAGRVQGLERLPVHRRADGQEVRYAAGVLSAGEARPLDIFIALDRQADGPAELAALSGLEAMRTLLEGSFSAAGKIAAAQVRSLADAFAATDCYTLRYADLDAAIDRLRRLADE